MRERASDHPGKQFEARSAARLDPTEMTCFNCGVAPATPAHRFLYCSELCQEEAKLVRYWRAVIRDGRIRQPDVAEALKIRIGLVLGGGYPERERRISSALRAEIFQRDGSRCQICGGEATQIDHIGDDQRSKDNVNDPLNLQAVCDRCHRKKTLSRFRLAVPEEKGKARWLELRAENPEPSRESDDEVNWQRVWREWARERSAAARASR